MDYMKIIKTIALLFGVEDKFDMEARHENADIFDIRLTTTGGRLITYQVIHLPNEAVIVFLKQDFSEAEFAKFLSKLEYELEQVFFRNIRIEIMDRTKEYRIKIAG